MSGFSEYFFFNEIRNALHGPCSIYIFILNAAEQILGRRSRNGTTKKDTEYSELYLKKLRSI